MCKKVTDIKKAKQDKREKKGWTLEEIRKNAEEELNKFKHLAENEPDDLVSGDMENTIEEKEPDDDNEEE